MSRFHFSPFPAILAPSLSPPLSSLTLARALSPSPCPLPRHLSPAISPLSFSLFGLPGLVSSRLVLVLVLDFNIRIISINYLLVHSLVLTRISRFSFRILFLRVRGIVFFSFPRVIADFKNNFSLFPLLSSGLAAALLPFHPLL